MRLVIKGSDEDYLKYAAIQHGLDPTNPEDIARMFVDMCKAEVEATLAKLRSSQPAEGGKA